MAKKRRRKDNFVENVTRLLSSISQTKKELRLLKNEELKKLNLSEKEQIKLVKDKTKQQKKKIIDRYEKRKENLGKTLLKRKNQELGKHLSVERKSLNRTNKEIGRVKKNQRSLKKD